MRFDMHCHTRKGSLDSKIDIQDYVRILKQKGFQGMLVTDHNSYNGYRNWVKLRREKKIRTDFVVLKGVEYDTLDAGHILVIMPKGIHLRILEVRGLPVHMLIRIVHQCGGILGPAHPYGTKFMSAMCSKKMEKDQTLAEEFDFIEAFNTCELPESNKKAREMTQRYRKPGLGGSDAHREAYVGTAYTDIAYPVKNNDDLIYAIKNGYVVGCGGQEREPKEKNVILRMVPLGDVWRVYNRGVALLRSHTRRMNLEKIFLLNMLKEREKKNIEMKTKEEQSS